MKDFYVIVNDFNEKTFGPYNVMPYLVEQYSKARVKPHTFDEFKEFVKKEAMYQWMSRCEYEIVVSDWPNQTHPEKWDVYMQLMMNIDTVTRILIENVFEL